MEIRIPVIGQAFSGYSKAVPGAIAINFAPSGSVWCSDSCDLKATLDGEGRAPCYSQMSEQFRAQVKAGLQRKMDNMPLWLEFLTSGIAREVYAVVPWIRFCSHGPLPMVEDLSADERAAFVRLGEMLLPHVRKIHIPIEERSKAEAYRALLGITPRLSLQRDGAQSAEMISETVADVGMPVAVVVDANAKKGKLAANIKKSRELQRELIAIGKTAKVCPSIIGSAKCGPCKLCAAHGPEIIIYPRHY